MTLYLRVRGARVIAAVAAVVVALLAWPGSSVEATPSPTGATMMAGVFLVIAVPAVIGWGCARGDDRLEATGVRAIAWADLVLAVVASAAVALVTGALHAAGLADAGIPAARATLTYLGLLLLAVPFTGWRLAPVAPSLLPWGSKTPIRSCGRPVVLVDEPTEQVPPANVARVGRDRLSARCEG